MSEGRLASAYESLEGLSSGDAFGECFFGPKEEALSSGILHALLAPEPTD